MKKMTLLIPVAVALMAHAACPEEPYYRDLYPDTWVATDALGRTMPDFSTVGPVKNDQRRIVGIFYITWHSDSLAGLKSPYAADVTKVLAADPNARLDAKHPLWTEGSYHWGEPEMGYFLSKDEYVIRKDMSMLSDAGVPMVPTKVTVEPTPVGMRVTREMASSSAGTTSLTRPILSASAASMILPVYISFRAFSTPTSRGRNQVHPVSATIARFTKIALKRAASEAMRMSQAIASEKPAPTLAPFTAASVGLRQ